jgi:predicted Zn-dependent protease
MSRRRLAIVALIALFVPQLVALGCATNPVSGKREFSLVSGAQEEQIGREGFPAVKAEYGLYDHASLAALVDSVGQKLARVSHRPDLQWHFTLLDDPTVNAFAMPGGYIYITRGILAHLNSEAQLAGVIGHEIGHVTARHSAQRITQQQVAGLGLTLASAFSEGFRRYSQGAETALGLVFLKYGRDDENQADELGIEYATKAGYDPREIPGTYAMLKRIGDSGGERLPEFLSTHPDPGNREARTAELARAAAAGKTGLIIRERDYIRRMEGVTYGVDPRNGYFTGSTYYHPSLQFQITMPSGWKTQDSRSAVMAGEPNQRATLQLTLAAAGDRSPSAFVEELVRAGKVAGADGRSETVGGFPAWVGRLAVNTQSGQAILVAAFIRKAPDQMFQILGQSATAGDANEDRVIESARSFRRLTDPSKLNVAPAVVHVITAPSSGAFSSVVESQGPLAAPIDRIAILNNVDAGESVAKGQSLKIVTPGRP